MFGTGGRPLSPKTVNGKQIFCAKSPKERGAKEPREGIAIAEGTDQY